MSGKRARGVAGKDAATSASTLALQDAAAAGLPTLPSSAAHSMHMQGLPAAATAGMAALDHDGLAALGLAQEQARRRESTGSLSSKYWLSLSPQPPKHPFVNAWFPLKVFLVDSKKSLKSGWSLRLTAELLYENGELAVNQSAGGEMVEVLAVNTAAAGTGTGGAGEVILGPTGSVDLKVRIKTAFQLRFSALPAEVGLIPPHVTLMPVVSSSMQVIRHKLQILEQPPALWYKDEGGRDKCMSITAQLVDEHEQLVQNREVPLKVLLCYEGDDCVEVKNQSILKMPLESVPKVDRHGRVSLRVRIEEVSKNHQKQAFVLKLLPDVAYSPDQGDISADVTSAVTVLSKRNKRRIKHGGGGDRGAGGIGAGGQDDGVDSPELGPMQPVAVGGGGGFAPNLYLNPPTGGGIPVGAANTAASTLPFKAQAAQQHAVLSALGGVSSRFDASTTSTVANSSTLPSITPTGGLAKPHTGGVLGMPSATSMTGGMLLGPSLSQTSLHGHRMAHLSSSDGGMGMGGMGMGMGGDGVADLKGAFISSNFVETVSHLVNWCQHVHDLFLKIEWQHVGFEVQQDGQLNMHRPLFRCPGCWSYQDSIRQTGHRDSCKISRLSNTYTSHVHTYLQDLVQWANQATQMALGTGAGTPAPSNQQSSQQQQQQNASSTSAINGPLNSLLAAYSKQQGGSSYMMDTSSSSAAGGAGSNGPNVRNQFPSSSPSSSSALPRVSSMFRSSSPDDSSDDPVAKKAKTEQQLQHSSLSMQVMRDPTGMSQLSQRPFSSSAAPMPAAASNAAASANALFPPVPSSSSAGDWQNLAPLDPLSSPPHGGLLDRGLSTLSNGMLLAAGLGGSSSSGVGANESNANPAFANLVTNAFQQHGSSSDELHMPSSSGVGVGGVSGGDDLPPPHSLLLHRAGSSINLLGMGMGGSGSAGGGGGGGSYSLSMGMSPYGLEEGQVDAIHVVATEYGFPAFGGPTTAPNPAQSNATTPAAGDAASSAAAAAATTTTLAATSTSPSVPPASSSSSGPHYPLLGFYQYDESTSVLTFVPLACFPPLPPSFLASLESSYAQLRANGGAHDQNPEESRILTRAQTITLDRLKEEALLLHYQAQASNRGFMND